MNRIYYYKTLRMMLIIFIAAPVMIAASFYVTTIPMGIMAKVIGYIGVAFFGLCFIVGLYNFLRGTFRREALTLTQASLMVNTPSNGSFTLKWSDISNIDTTRIGNERMLVIRLYDPQTFIEQQGNNAIRRKLMEADTALVGSPCAVALNNIDAGDDDIEQIINKYVADYGRKPNPKDGPTQD